MGSQITGVFMSQQTKPPANPPGHSAGLAVSQSSASLSSPGSLKGHDAPVSDKDIHEVLCHRNSNLWSFQCWVERFECCCKMPHFLAGKKRDFDEPCWQNLLVLASGVFVEVFPSAQTHTLKTCSHASSSRYIQQNSRSQGKHHPRTSFSPALGSTLPGASNPIEIDSLKRGFKANRASCIINRHPFPSAHFRKWFCLLLAWLETMKPNQKGLERTSRDHLLHHPFPKAYRVNNRMTSLQNPAARLCKFGFF